MGPCAWPGAVSEFSQGALSDLMPGWTHRVGEREEVLGRRYFTPPPKFISQTHNNPHRGAAVAPHSLCALPCVPWLGPGVLTLLGCRMGRGSSSRGTQMTSSSFLAPRRPCRKPMAALPVLLPPCLLPRLLSGQEDFLSWAARALSGLGGRKKGAVTPLLPLEVGSWPSS